MLEQRNFILETNTYHHKLPFSTKHPDSPQASMSHQYPQQKGKIAILAELKIVCIYIEIYRYIQYISPNQTSLHPTSPLNSQPHLSDVPALAAVRHTETGVKKMSTYQTRMLSFPRIIR